MGHMFARMERSVSPHRYTLAISFYRAPFLPSLSAIIDRRTRHRNRPSYPPPLQPSKDAPGVSILRPLRGLDCNLIENLESSFRQDYPKFEIIFSVAEEDDQAVPIVRGLIEKYPGVRARLIIGGLLFPITNAFRCIRCILNKVCGIYRARRRRRCRTQSKDKQPHPILPFSSKRHNLGPRLKRPNSPIHPLTFRHIPPHPALIPSRYRIGPPRTLRDPP
jgi:cellulose synthase/poly-beta-1,6-N-acetylglucosamine synthase-like glycosyltransferase